MLDVLREETGELHIELERITESSKMKDGNYTLEDYQRYILTNYYFHQTVEQNIFSHQEENINSLLLQYRRKTSYLLRDLNILRINFIKKRFDLSGRSLPHTMGYLYVAEGSMLGAAVIHKLLKDKPQFNEAGAFHFLGCYEGQKRELWATFKKYVDIYDWDAARREVMIKAAKEAFLLYKKVFNHVQSIDHS